MSDGLRDAGLPAGAVEALDDSILVEIAPCLAYAAGEMARAKALVHALRSRIGSTVIEATVAALAARWESFAAFFDKRRSVWR